MQISEDTIQEIPVSEILAPRYELRPEISRNEIVGLAQSIKTSGLIEPIVVRRTSLGYELIAGGRRVRAFKMLGLERIKSRVVEASDKEAFELSLVENIHHQTLNPIDEAMAYHSYTERFGYGSISALAQRIGKSQEYISLRLALLRLPKDVLDLVISRQIKPSIAQELLPLNSVQQRRLSELVIQRGLTKRDVRRAVKVIEREGDIEVPDLPPGMDSTHEIEDIEEFYVGKSLKVLKNTILSLDEIIDSLPDESLLRSILFEWRLNIHDEISCLVKIKAKALKHRRR